MANVFSYANIQDRIDKLDDTRWLQANAFYPVKFFYTDRATSTNQFTIDAFLNYHTNNTAAGDILVSQKEDDPKTLTDYMQKELELSGKDASELVLRQFSKLSGLKPLSLALSKNNGALKADKDESKDATVTLEFLCDREFKVLDYLQAWQSKWYTFDYQKKSLVAKGGEDRSGGEGFLGLANCAIDIDGNISVQSHLSLFGLIPKTITPLESLGPQITSTNLPKISVVCTYAHAILVYPKKDKLGYFYFS